LDRTEKKFNGRAQLYVGGIPTSVTEEQLKEWFAEFGEVGEIY
jgi:RNA recognition motif-containing protein